MDFWNCRVIILLASMSCLVLNHRVCRTYREEHLLDFGFGTRLVHFIFISAVSFIKTSLQVDGDGESYWVFDGGQILSGAVKVSGEYLVEVQLAQHPRWVATTIMHSSKTTSNNKEERFKAEMDAKGGMGSRKI